MDYPQADRFAPDTVTIRADDLHSRQPFCEHLCQHHFNFILVCHADENCWFAIALFHLLESVNAFQKME